MKWIILLVLQSVFAQTFTKTTPEEAWKLITPGWNLGNTLDAIPTEGSWNNAPVTNQTITEIKAAGFKSVRIPVTWTNHFDTDAPSFNITASWLDRVEAVVDMVLFQGLWAVLNVHHDSWDWADLSNDEKRITGESKLERLWVQISDRMKWKSERLILESLNEPVGSTKEVADIYNQENARFSDIVRNSGGYNKDRIISLPSLATNIQYAIDWFVPPANISNWSLQVHYYSPWDFISNWWGRTFWGSQSDLDAMTNDLSSIAGNFSDVKILIGEFGTGGVGIIVEKAAAWLWFDHFSRTARKLGIAIQLWDNGNDFYDRVNHVWRDPTTKNIILAASAGIINTIPENGNATIWLKQGDIITDRSIHLMLNGNSIKGVTSGTGTALSSSDYSLGGSTVILKASYLSSLPATTLGSISTVVIQSSQGVDLPIEIRRYTTPTVSATYFASPPTSSNLDIPVSLNGAKIATMKAMKADGTILKDDWTQYLGPLQQGRMNWGDFDSTENSLIVSSSMLATIQASGQAVNLTFEFWPRTDQTNNILTTVSYV